MTGKPETKYIRFRANVKTKEKEPQSYVQGRIYGFTNESSFNRWITRGHEAVTSDDFREQVKADQAAKAPPPKAAPGQPAGEGQGNGQGGNPPA